MDQNRQHPVEAELAKEEIGLIAFAKKAGANIFSVIPAASRTQTYLKGPAKIHHVCDPEMITELLAGVGRKFPKSQFTHNVIGLVVGKGMILAEGEKWREQRHRYAPLFAARNLPVLTSHFAKTGDDLADFFVQANVRETLRMYPAGALFARDATSRTEIKGVIFNKGDVIMSPVYSLHRNQLLWENAAEYQADRLIDRKYPRGQYMPFGDGPRICISAQYAEAEIMVFPGSVLRRASFAMTDDRVAPPNLSFTMRPGGPLILRAEAVQA